jgi:predicted Na+-dependent transporter
MKIDPQLLKCLSLLNQIGIQMIVPIFLCLMLGKWLDEKLNLNNKLTFVFIMLGIMAAMRNMIVLTTRFIQGGKGPKK